ncbi:MAG: hypothetical protein FWH57_09965 [Oscillospiraceae bacterium]|nr:hypothetical protein [Oscillospiraceae bacterium]
MLTLKEQAVDMVQSFPEEKMSYVIEILKWIVGVLDDKSRTSFGTRTAAIDNPSEAIKAWERFKAYKSIVPYDIDIKAELAQARDEKYANSI